MTKPNKDRETPEILEFMRARVSYDRRSGEFRWKSRPRADFPLERVWRDWENNRAGRIAGSVNKKLGYVGITITRYIEGERQSLVFLGHRLAWALETGAWPEHRVDHRDRNPSNNRFRNLRPATDQQNVWNTQMKRVNASGFTGVDAFPAKSGVRYRAFATDPSGRRRHLGMFATAEEASAVRDRKLVEWRGEYAKTSA